MNLFFWRKSTADPQTGIRVLPFEQKMASALDNLVAAVEENSRWNSLRRTLNDFDDRYQQWIQERMDPLLSGTRSQHAETLTQTTAALPETAELAPMGVKLEGVIARSIDEQTREVNRNIGLSVFLTLTAVVAKAALLPATLICLPMGLYISRSIFQAAYADYVTERKVGDPALASLLMLGTFLGGFYIAGGVASMLYYLANKVILVTQDRSRNKLVNIIGQLPSHAWILIDGQETEIPLAQVQAGDTIVVGAGQVIPVDGVVVAGHATVDQHRLSGEAQPVEKAKEDRVMAATMVLAGKIYVQVSQTGVMTVAAQIGEILNNTASQPLLIESKAIQVVDQAAMPTLLTAGLAWPLVGYQGAVAITGASIGYNLRLTGPISMLNYLNMAAEMGILIKDGRSLELLHEIDTVIFDKTGTLTEEQPQVVHVDCLGTVAAAELLAYAAAVESRQSHPIARAIVAAAQQQGLSLPEIDDTHYVVGYGLQAQIDGHQVRIGSSRFMELEGIAVPQTVTHLLQRAHSQGHSVVMVSIDEQLAGTIELEPTIRAEVAEIVADLHRRKIQVYILSGDQEQPTEKLARSLGIDHYFANTLPGDKAAHVARLQAAGHKVCFIGDGINDSLALRQANVSISLSGATSVAIDTAQIVMMDQSLRQLPALLNLVDEFNGNMRAGFVAAMVPGFVTIGGVFLLKLGIFASTMIYNVGLMAGVGIAMWPLLLHRSGKDPVEMRLEESGAAAVRGVVLHGRIAEVYTHWTQGIQQVFLWRKSG